MYWECYEETGGTLSVHASLPVDLSHRLGELSGHSEIHQMPDDVLVSNMNVGRAGTYKQLSYLRFLCQQLEITEVHLVAMGIEEGRIHPTRINLLQWDNPLDGLTISEIGGLFAFRALLQSDES